MKRPPPKKKTGEHLSAEEHALWRHVADSIKPIRAKSRVRGVGSTEMHADDAEPAPSHPVRRPAKAKAVPPGSSPTTPTERQHSATAASVAPPLADFDPRKARKLGNGRSGIEARIDLHGLRHDEAHARLQSFLTDAHARGLKTVLVITGKGRDTDDPMTPFHATLDRQPRGVLRRNLPRWLAEPGLRSIVVSYTQAAIRHGGDGAFYVELRRRR